MISLITPSRLAQALVAVTVVTVGLRLSSTDAVSAQPRPAATVELFGEGVFSTGAYELPPTFAPDGNTAYFTVSTPQYGRMRYIMETRRTAKGWSQPQLAPFSGQYDDADPYFSPDGNSLFFLSKRPIAPGGPAKRDLDIWVMKREGQSWGAPQHLGNRVNGQADEHYVTATKDGTLYIAAVRPDSRNLGDVYRIPVTSAGYGEPENLGYTVNSSELHDTTPWVSRDGDYIIFGSRGRTDSFGDLDLYIATRGADGAWSAPKNLGAGINSSAGELCPLVSPDGRYMYFTSTRSFIDTAFKAPITSAALRTQLNAPGNGLGDTYRVPMAEVLKIAGIEPAAKK